MNKAVKKIYGDRVRTRVCGLCWENEHLLLVNHRGLYGYDFWAPPGGGIDFGVSALLNLAREFNEETGLTVSVGDFQFACEFLHPPLHAIELFFEVQVTGGRLIVGKDPEMGSQDQIIQDVRFFSFADLAALPAQHLHGLLNLPKNRENLRNLKGYFKI